MSESPEVIQTVIDGRASGLAHQVGQSVEQILIDRAVTFATNDAGECAEVVVTAEHVQLALETSILEDTCRQIGIFINGEARRRSSRPDAA